MSSQQVAWKPRSRPSDERQVSAARINRLASIRSASALSRDRGCRRRHLPRRRHRDQARASTRSSASTPGPHETGTRPVLSVTSDAYFTERGAGRPQVRHHLPRRAAHLRADLARLLRDDAACPPAIRSGSSTTSSPATSSPRLPSQEDAYALRKLHGLERRGSGMATSTSASSRSTTSSRTSASAPSSRGTATRRPSSSTGRGRTSRRASTTSRRSRGSTTTASGRTATLLNLLPEEEVFDWVAAAMRSDRRPDSVGGEAAWS